MEKIKKECSVSQQILKSAMNIKQIKEKKRTNRFANGPRDRGSISG